MRRFLWRRLFGGKAIGLVHPAPLYGVRVPKRSGDELGILVDRFNEMPAGIRSRDNNLRTALREREEALRDAEKAPERFRFMAESMPQKIFTALPNGGIDYMNRQWFELSGVLFDELKSAGCYRFIHPEDIQEYVCVWQTSIETGEPFLFRDRFRRAEVLTASMWTGSQTDIHEQKKSRKNCSSSPTR